MNAKKKINILFFTINYILNLKKYLFEKKIKSLIHFIEQVYKGNTLVTSSYIFSRGQTELFLDSYDIIVTSSKFDQSVSRNVELFSVVYFC